MIFNYGLVAVFGCSKPFLLCHVDYCRKLLSTRLDCHPASEAVSRRRRPVQDLICPFSVHSLRVNIPFGMIPLFIASRDIQLP